MYLKLSVAGHLTIFVTRTRGPFWSMRPARVLWLAVLGTQIVATLIAVYGVFMTPLGWGWALFVWCYALAWFLCERPGETVCVPGFGFHHRALVGQGARHAATLIVRRGGGLACARERTLGSVA